MVCTQLPSLPAGAVAANQTVKETSGLANRCGLLLSTPALFWSVSSRLRCWPEKTTKDQTCAAGKQRDQQLMRADRAVPAEPQRRADKPMLNAEFTGSETGRVTELGAKARGSQG